MGFVGGQLLVERVIFLLGLLHGFLQAQAAVGQVLGRGAMGQELLDGFAQGAVPVLVEAVTQLFGHRADTEQVDVGEVQVGFGVEILIAQVATADDGHAVIRQPQLVVHPAVLLRKVEQAAEAASHAGGTSQVQRVEQADLDLRMSGEGGDDLILAIAGGVVQQYPYAHAPVGGLEQFIYQHPRADAVMDDVVLQIQAALGVANQLGPGNERVGAVR
ncbi:hypothetical protein SAMN03159306_01290 [Pseudomonas sp. NFACC48-1]|nr:hypothetical protein SAMN03159405_04374 [Pseudomonas sp. NFACC44-2]SDA55939.1 hypothetical protein SAMN03159429_01447 [Pseudomonas sp. NFACC51]SFI27532.1 hypothetical protein SAMN03159302_03784 [Pseudomonas sp. NFACC54]SFS63965.1 hypothetical protein SAMN03159306_01290 [Pseudomonas sp. NFACC48-1]